MKKQVKFIEVHVLSETVPISLNVDRIVDFYPDNRVTNGAYIKCVDGLLHVTESYAYLQIALGVVKRKSPHEVKDKAISIDIMHYKGNNLAFGLILLSILLNVVMFIIIYRVSTSIYAANVQLGIDLFINVFYMLLCFLAAEKTKHYSRDWAKVSVVLGIVQVARIFWIPLVYFLNKGLSVGAFTACVVLLSACAACNIIAGIVTNIKYWILEDHEPIINEEGAKKDVRT